MLSPQHKRKNGFYQKTGVSSTGVYYDLNTSRRKAVLPLTIQARKRKKSKRKNALLLLRRVLALTLILLLFPGNDTLFPEAVSTPVPQVSPSPSPSPEPTPLETVWVSATGKKYHASSTCSGMNSPTAIPIEEAIARELSPCGTCIGD